MFEYSKNVDREEALLRHVEQPKTEGDLQMVLMGEYYLSQHPELHEDDILGDNRATHDSAIATEWATSGLGNKFRVVMTDPEYKGRLDVTLEQIKFYSTPDA
jgi:hypothetical protein